MTIPRKLKTIFSAALLVILAAAPTAHAAAIEAGGKFGFTDFASYWTACSIFKAGKNPYDAAQFEAAASLLPADIVGQRQLSPVWNPPWMLSMICPLMQDSPLLSGRIWIAVNLVLLALTLAAGLSLFKPDTKINTWRPAAAGALFAPTLQIIGYGQISLIVVCASVCSFALARKNRWFTSGALLFMSAIKPHLLLGVYLLWGLSVIKKRVISGIAGFTAAAAVLSFLAAHQSPGIFESWLMRAEGTMSYRTPTLVYLGRLASRHFLAQDPLWLAAVVPIITLSVFAAAAWRFKLSMNALIPLSFAASALAAPYGWFFDFTTLLVLPLSLACSAETLWHANRRKAIAVYMMIIGAQILISASGSYLPNHEQFFWVPPMMLLVWICGRISLGDKAPS